MFGLLKHRGRTAGHLRPEEQSAFIDGQLPPGDAQRAQRHLEECPGCRAEVEAMKGTVALLRSLPPVRAPHDFRIPLSMPAPALPFWLRPAAYATLRAATAVAAAVLVVALAGQMVAGSRLGAPGARMFTSAQPEAGIAALSPTASVTAAAAFGEPEAESLKAAPQPPHRGPLTARGDEAAGIPERRTPLVGERGAGENGPEVLLAPPEAPAREQGEMGAQALPPPPAPRPAGLVELWRRLAADPWWLWAVGAGVALLVLGAATLRLRALRRRWL